MTKTCKRKGEWMKMRLKKKRGQEVLIQHVAILTNEKTEAFDKKIQEKD